MRLTIVIFMLLMVNTAFGSGWYCEEVASEWMEKGVLLQSCGIGYGSDENAARLDAFNNARKEFENICNGDTNCANNIVNVDPQRTSCDKKDDSFVCHRLFYYHITEKKRYVQAPIREPKVIEIKTTEKPTIVNNTNHITVHKHFNTIKKAVFKEGKYKKYKTFLRSANGVSIYETNSHEYQGIHLTNPSEAAISRAVKRGSSSGGMPRIYIHRN